MYIQFTPQAIERYHELRGNKEGMLHLFYETEGCGCGNSGIFSLHLVSEMTAEDKVIQSNVGDLLIKDWTMHFLEASLVIDYLPEKNALVLKGDSGYYNTNLLFVA